MKDFRKIYVVATTVVSGGLAVAFIGSVLFTQQMIDLVPAMVGVALICLSFPIYVYGALLQEEQEESEKQKKKVY